MSRLVLASGSPRRQWLLEQAGYDFTIVVPDVDETMRPGESPEAMVERLAIAKARAVADQVPGAVVLAADTTVDVDGRVLAKPADETEAAAMLLELAGRSHWVHTGWALIDPAGKVTSGVTASRIEMRPIEEAEALTYAAGGEPLDKAGAYAIQGEGGKFVASVSGSYTNVMGLPMEEIEPLLAGAGIAPATGADVVRST